METEDIQSMPDQKLQKEIKANGSNYLEQLEIKNSQVAHFLDYLDSFKEGKYSDALNKLLTIYRIDTLHPIQEICLKYIMDNDISCFSIVGIGNGKTMLCNILGAFLSHYKKEKVIIMNKVKNLSQRNAILFEQTFGQSLNLIVNFDGKVTDLDSNVAFLCEDEIFKYLKENNHKINDYIIIMDEADQILFSEECRQLKANELKKWKDKIVNFRNAKRLLCFTGTLTSEEKIVVQSHIVKTIVEYPQINESKEHKLIKLKDQEFNNKEEWINLLSSEIIRMHKQVPIVVLSSQLYEKALLSKMRTLTSDYIQITSLLDKNAVEINTALQQSVVLNNQNTYPVYIVDEILGRGLDIKTNSKIEENGGLYVIISVIPSSTKVLKQVKWRTQRMLNKGQFSLIYYNNKDKNLANQLQEGDTFIHLNLLKLSQLLKQDHKQIEQENTQHNLMNADTHQLKKVNMEEETKVCNKELNSMFKDTLNEANKLKKLEKVQKQLCNSNQELEYFDQIFEKSYNNSKRKQKINNSQSDGNKKGSENDLDSNNNQASTISSKQKRTLSQNQIVGQKRPRPMNLSKKAIAGLFDDAPIEVEQSSFNNLDNRIVERNEPIMQNTSTLKTQNEKEKQDYLLQLISYKGFTTEELQ